MMRSLFWSGELGLAVRAIDYLSTATESEASQDLVEAAMADRLRRDGVLVERITEPRLLAEYGTVNFREIGAAIGHGETAPWLFTGVGVLLFIGACGKSAQLPLMTWLQEVIFPAEACHVDEEFVRWGTRLACLEMIRGGTTTFVDMYYFEDAIAEEVDEAIEELIGEGTIGHGGGDTRLYLFACPRQ